MCPQDIHEMIEIAKKSEYGCVWYSENGPIQITKEGELIPMLQTPLPNEILDATWVVNLKKLDVDAG